jgi:hypothetical protein
LHFVLHKSGEAKSDDEQVMIQFGMFATSSRFPLDKCDVVFTCHEYASGIRTVSTSVVRLYIGKKRSSREGEIFTEGMGVFALYAIVAPPIGRQNCF